MTINDLLSRLNVLNAVIIKDDLSKSLKVKIVRLRISYNKVKASFDEEVQEFTKTIISDEFKELQAKETRTEEENSRYKELEDSINSEYNEYMQQKAKETISFDIDDKFKEDEFDELIVSNAGSEVEINNNKIKGEQLMEIFYNLFVKEEDK